jgi:hypothetical protein
MTEEIAWKKNSNSQTNEKLDNKTKTDITQIKNLNAIHS